MLANDFEDGALEAASLLQAEEGEEAEELPASCGRLHRLGLYRLGMAVSAGALLFAGAGVWHWSYSEASASSSDVQASTGLAEHSNVASALLNRAGNQGKAAFSSLASTLTGKPTPTVASPGWCPGFKDWCEGVEYPMPYKNGDWPSSYDYTGQFPKDFIWGLGTAAYQVEGAYREGGRGASIWDTFSGADTVGMPGADCSYCCKKTPCNINKAMYDKGATGNVAADHYHMWKTDIALMKSMGLKHYRFSISWPRLVPTGRVKDGVNEHAKEFYNNLIDGLLEAGITPYVTLYHWDLPQGLLDPPKINGWWARDKSGKPVGEIILHFKDYAELCFKFFGDRVKTWVTFNEAWTFTFLASGWGKAPSIAEFNDMSVDPWVAGHNVLNAHAQVVDLYRRDFQKKQGGKIGITHNADWKEPKTTNPQDIAAAERNVLFQLGWFAEPIFGKHGDYPPEMRLLYGSRLPKFTDDEKKLLKGSADFFGLNHYGTHFAEYDPANSGADLSYHSETEEDFGVVLTKGMSEWLFSGPWGFRKLLNWIKNRYNNPNIIVTEGGWSLPAHNANEAVSDQQRMEYFANYSAEMLKAIHQDGVDVRGYFGWSLVDNFEWERGYKERFGVVYNDFMFGEDQNAPTAADEQPTRGSQWRQRKESSCYLERVWSTNKLSDPYKFEGCAGKQVLMGSFIDTDSQCPRNIKSVRFGRVIVEGVMPELVTVNGTMDLPFAKKCVSGKPTVMEATSVRVSGGSIIMDYSKSGGPSNFGGFYSKAKDSIVWADGSTWKRQTPP